MKNKSSAIRSDAKALSSRSGLAWGGLGVLAFSFTVPLTRVAIAELSPAFVGAGRAVVAAALAAIALGATRQRLPSLGQWRRIALVAGGVVMGFPMLTSYALTTAPAAHGAMVVGLLPAATAIAAVIRTGERPGTAFWLFGGLGAAAVLAFTGLHNGGFGLFEPADLLLFGAVIAAAVGYAEGGLLARELGAWQVVSWALVLAAPLMALIAVVSAVQEPPMAGPASWAAFGYLAVVSMFLGFFAWYRGLAIGPMARVSQVQLVQPVLSMLWAALILGEAMAVPTLIGGVAVILCAGLAVRSRRGGSGRGRVESTTPSSRTEEDS
ncbi:drug/metabolite transporter (DMT)-like permease [Microbacterium resistens]|uniref:Drug/metabolite transporter (DMT)-like permease n=1 Tax=Microbacterium resistens TaxID=156977 RepID=A0ABU1SH55_9MICO|nr:DMT family transporter [Microbacterium resistens]MDR6868593.1 drug/metabolite transporter (DMT)-like permease [Microbacterium resistens]